MDTNLVTESYVLQTASRRWGLDPVRTGTEYHSPCPRCGGRDRLVIFENGFVWCRPGNGHCGMTAWLDDDQPYTPDTNYPRVDLAHIRRQQKDETLAAWQDGFKQGFFVRQWHEAMQEAQRAWYRKRGIEDWLQDYYELGYMPEKWVSAKEGNYILPAYTIPTRDSEFNIVGMQYRLADPPKGVQKYRYEGGVPAHPFFAVTGEFERAIVVEGAFKAIVVADRYVAREKHLQVVGLTFNGLDNDGWVMQKLEGFKSIWLILDPDSTEQARAIQKLRKGIKVVDNLGMKVDDAFLAGMTANQFKNYCDQAR